MGFFTAYFDESGKYQTNRVVSFCGLLGSDLDWTNLRGEWEYLLRKNKLPYLHISKGDLKATAQQIRLYRPLVQAITKNVERGFAAMVDVAAFKETHKVIRKAFRDDPHYLVFNVALHYVIDYVERQSSPTVAVVCDDEASKACECYKSFDVMRQNAKQPENRRILKSIAFADAKFYPQLQAADLFSWASRAESLHRFFGEEFSLREIFSEFNMVSADRRIGYDSGFWDAKNLKDLSTGTTRALGLKD